MKSKHLQGFRLLAGILALVLLVSLVFSLAACSSSSPSTTAAAPKTTAAAPPPPQSSSAAPVAPASSASAPAPTSSAPAPASSAPASSAAAGTFLLRMAPGGDNPPPAEGYTKAVTDFVDIIQNRTNGRVKVQIYWSQTLTPQNNITQAIQSGAADLAQLAPHQEAGRIPLSMVSQLPGTGTDMWARNWAYYDLCNQDPLKSELAKYNMKTISAMAMDDQYLITTKPVRTLADLKGKKIAAAGIGAEVMSTLGAVPVNLSPPDQYSGMQKGTLDGAASPLAAVNDFKFYEVAKYYTYLPSGPRVVPVVINQDTWNKFPADIQKIFTDALPDFITTSTDAFVKITNGDALKAMKAANVELINLNDADMATVNQILAGQADKWANGIGDNAKKVLADYRTLDAKYEKTSPYLKK